MSRRETPKPGATSNIAAAAASAGAMPPPGAAVGQPALVPGNGRVIRGEHQAQERAETAADGATAATTEDPKPGRRPAGKRGGRGGRRAAPAVASAVALTVRLDPDEANNVDLFILGLREEARRTRLDKSEVLRELLRMAQDHEPTRRALLRRIA